MIIIGSKDELVFFQNPNVGGAMRVDRNQDDTAASFVIGIAIVMLGLLFRYPWVVALGLIFIGYGLVTRYRQRRDKPPD